MLESSLEKRLVRDVEKAGGLCWKIGQNGKPDRMCLLPDGKAVFVEMKRPGEEPRPLQKKMHRRLRSLGFTVEVIDSQEGIEVFIREIRTASLSGLRD
ncbi:VRR-NUC domain-containing protein [Paenibacillus senegalensis]|uniref:VRR-NUC domain-containing protein n=1 Tax=Paenibacillus senegalensis TaxID=1465766 RepID=UPI0002884F9B|nr:VRR-NUC domain-containing protein [Paenibacillus senegalensis]